MKVLSVRDLSAIGRKNVVADEMVGWSGFGKLPFSLIPLLRNIWPSVSL
jgi:hypothetical protein